MRRYGSPNEIVTDKLGSYGAAARELGCPKRLLNDGLTTELRIHIYLSTTRKSHTDLDECTVYKFASIHASFHNLFNSRKGHSQNAVNSN